jgi:hypothetical protein
MDWTLGVRTAWSVAATLLLCLAAPAAETITYIGTLPSEPPARIAVVVEGNTFLAYACGKTDDFNQAASAWFKGTMRTNRLEAEVDGKSFAAELSGGVVRGTLTVGGRKRDFTAKPVAANAVAGLYRAIHDVNGEMLVMGWIIDANHQIVGGCQGTKRKPIALQPKAPPVQAENQPPEQKQEAPQQQVEDLVVQQVDEQPGVAVQGQKVKSAVNPPVGKVLARANPKKK